LEGAVPANDYTKALGAGFGLGIGSKSFLNKVVKD